MHRKYPAPVFLYKQLSYSLVSLAGLIYLFTTVPPTHPLLVLLFLVLLFVAVSSGVSLLIFVVKFREHKRVWYLKEDQFSSIYNILVFLSLGLILFLFLKYIQQVNLSSILLVLLTVVGGYVLFRLGELKSRK